jgi:hypothetical protein
MILGRFRQQPGEVRSRTISFARFLELAGETAAGETPTEVLVPEGLTLVADAWVDDGNYYKFLIQGVAGRHKMTIWLNTSGGQRLEADVIFTIKDE